MCRLYEVHAAITCADEKKVEMLIFGYENYFFQEVYDIDLISVRSTKYLPITTIILTGFDFIIACGRCH